MQIDEIDRKIEQIKASDINKLHLWQLFMLLELKIRELTGMEDLKTFRNYTDHLDMTQEDKDRLVRLRNLLAHRTDIEPELIKQNENWIKTQVIPAILSYRPDTMIPEIQENILLDEFGSKLQRLGFEVKKQPIIRIGDKSIQLHPDLMLESKDETIVFEVKATRKEDSKLIGLQQLNMYLLASKSKSGVLIILGDEHEIIEDNESSILIFGIDAPPTILEDWIKNRIDRKKRNKHKMDSKEP